MKLKIRKADFFTLPRPPALCGFAAEQVQSVGEVAARHLLRKCHPPRGGGHIKAPSLRELSAQADGGRLRGGSDCYTYVTNRRLWLNN